MDAQKNQSRLAEFPDELVLEEAADRLRHQFARDNGHEFLFGSFRFVYHEGRFQGVEDWPRNKRYVSPARSGTDKKLSR